MDDLVMQILSPILVAVVTAFVTMAVRMAFKGNAYLKTRLSAEHLAMLQNLAIDGIRSAEQHGLVELIENTGATKKAFAIEFVQEGLRALGLPYLADNVDLIGKIIEGAIKDALATNIFLQAEPIVKE